jgi:hypothetical protein
VMWSCQRVSAVGLLEIGLVWLPTVCFRLMSQILTSESLVCWLLVTWAAEAVTKCLIARRNQMFHWHLETCAVTIGTSPCPRTSSWFFFWSNTVSCLCQLTSFFWQNAAG